MVRRIHVLTDYLRLSRSPSLRSLFLPLLTAGMSFLLYFPSPRTCYAVHWQMRFSVFLLSRPHSQISSTPLSMIPYHSPYSHHVLLRLIHNSLLHPRIICPLSLSLISCALRTRPAPIFSISELPRTSLARWPADSSAHPYSHTLSRLPLNIAFPPIDTL